jgi:hypothetical protein
MSEHRLRPAFQHFEKVKTVKINQVPAAPVWLLHTQSSAAHVSQKGPPQPPTCNDPGTQEQFNAMDSIHALELSE